SNVGVSQLVNHQIKTEAEESYLNYIMYKSLLHYGHFFTINLTTEYLEYLSDHEPEKFKIVLRKDNYIEGLYRFDSGGEQRVYSRPIHIQLANQLATGFDFINAYPVITDKLQNHKERYKLLAEQDIPMFYIL